MDKQQTKTTDQQATNASLAALAAAGNSFALGQLWEINQGFLHRLFWQWYSKNKATADEHGLTLEDFDQEAFFAVRSAAQAYDPAKGSFLTLLSYYVQMTRKNLLAAENLLRPYLEEARNKQNVEDIYMLLTDVPKEESVVISDGRYASEVLSDGFERPTGRPGGVPRVPDRRGRALHRRASRRAGRSFGQAARAHRARSAPPVLRPADITVHRG